MTDLTIGIITANLLLTYFLGTRIRAMNKLVECIHENVHAMDLLFSELITAAENFEKEDDEKIDSPFQEWDRS